MNRQAQAAVLFLIGAAVLRAASTDLYLRYVKAGLRPLLVLAGAVLIAAAAATVWYELKARHKGGHTHREPRISWLLVLPLLALVLVAPPAPGSYSAMRAGTAVQPLPDYPRLPGTGTLRLEVGDYAGRALYDDGRHLRNRRIEMTGFLALDRGGAPHLTRMTLNCCAADAQPVKVRLAGKLPPTLRPDTWLKVTGTYSGKRSRDAVNGRGVPFFEVARARPVAAPADEYEG